jgi:hypothetical protein
MNNFSIISWRISVRYSTWDEHIIDKKNLLLVITNPNAKCYVLYVTIIFNKCPNLSNRCPKLNTHCPLLPALTHQGSI